MPNIGMASQLGAGRCGQGPNTARWRRRIGLMGTGLTGSL